MVALQEKEKVAYLREQVEGNSSDEELLYIIRNWYQMWFKCNICGVIHCTGGNDMRCPNGHGWGEQLFHPGTYSMDEPEEQQENRIE